MANMSDLSNPDTQPNKILQIGDQAPKFSLPRDGGALLTSETFAGNPYVLYFYPKDDTSGCTREAIDFSTLKPEFAAINVPVIGISPDSVLKHDKFIAKHGLAVTLAADEDKALSNAYGVWVEKSMYGRKYMGIERATYLIAADGTIAQVWRKVKVAGHAQAVLAAAQQLKANAE